jgi:mRNA-degrading endonuclease YafQ of YafQ-DinJ toxin-antitoxin module
MRTFRKISRLPQFDRDFKKLVKRFASLEEDLDILIDTQLNLFHKLGIDNHGTVPIGGLGLDIPVYKVLKFACRSLKGKGVKSGLRLIYTYYQEKDEIELIEIYYKGDKANEDRERIIKHYRR